MKKLYALLVILIVLYIGINVGANNLNLVGSDAGTADTTNATANVDGIAIGSSNFAKIDGFKNQKINDTALNLTNSNNLTITVNLLDSSQNITDVANRLIDSGSYTSNQVIDQNGVTTYFLYQESEDSYNADIFFSKNNQNYELSGDNITYDNSDTFINNCKNIIDTMSSSGSSGGFSKFG